MKNTAMAAALNDFVNLVFWVARLYLETLLNMVVYRLGIKSEVKSLEKSSSLLSLSSSSSICFFNYSFILILFMYSSLLLWYLTGS